jgi:uroporphyrinogen-III synthase
MPQIPPLNGIVCVITRPIHQTQHLYRLLTDAGAECILLPTIEIHPSLKNKYDLTNSLLHADKIIFVSANAAIQALTHLGADHDCFSPEIPVFAIGEGTKKALAIYHIKAITPDLFSSEGLLAHPLLQSVEGEHIIIFSGEGGRTLLFETLQKRHARVEQISVYRRVRPKASIAPLLKQEINYIISTSGESLENLWKMAREEDQVEKQLWLAQQRLVVISDHMKALAHDLGFTHPALVSSSASDGAIFQKILDRYTLRAR